MSIHDGQSNVQQYVSMGLLRHYFSVDNSYVLGKVYTHLEATHGPTDPTSGR